MTLFVPSPDLGDTTSSHRSTVPPTHPIPDFEVVHAISRFSSGLLKRGETTVQFHCRNADVRVNFEGSYRSLSAGR